MGWSMTCKGYGLVPEDQQRTMAGLELVQGLVAGTLPLNSMAQTVGYDIVAVEAGRVTVTAMPTAAHLNPAGGVHGGFAATRSSRGGAASASRKDA